MRRYRLLPLAAAAGAAAVVAASAIAAAPSATAAPRAASQSTPIYLNPAYSPAERAADLVSRMTTAEKAEEMDSSEAPAIPGLGVAAWGWWNEANHGVSFLTTKPSGNATQL